MCKNTQLTFEDTLNIVHDDGTKVDPIYYQVQGNKVVENPAATSLTRLTPFGTDKAKGKCNIALKLSQTPEQPVSYEVRIKTPKGDVLLDKVYATFNKTGKVSFNKIDFTIPYKIQIIKGVSIDYRIVEQDGNEWIPKSDWKEDSQAKPKEKFYVTLGDPLDPPFSEHGQDKITTGILDIACEMGSQVLSGEQAQDIITSAANPNAHELARGSDIVSST